MVLGGAALVTLHSGALLRVRGQPWLGQTQKKIHDDVRAQMLLGRHRDKFLPPGFSGVVSMALTRQ